MKRSTGHLWLHYVSMACSAINLASAFALRSQVSVLLFVWCLAAAWIQWLLYTEARSRGR